MKHKMRDRQATQGTRRRRHRRNRRPRFTHPERPRALPVVVQPIAAAIPPVAVTTVRVQRKHHLFVRWAHWTTIPLLLGLILSGISIYWSAPIFQHPTDATGNFDRAADIGIWLCAHMPGLHHYSSPPDWLYNHLSLGPGMLGVALRLHWFCAYLFMVNGALYLLGLVLGGGWRALIPQRSDVIAGLHMARYYSLAPFAFLLRRRLLHPEHTGKYNALQKAAYASVVIAGALAVLSGWAIHKPMQLYWLAAAFGGYNAARVAFLSHVLFHPLRRPTRRSGTGRWMGHHTQHDYWLVLENRNSRKGTP